MEIGVHPRFEYRDFTEFVEISGVRFVGESTSYQEVKVGVRRLAGSLNEVGTGDGAKFGANEDTGAFFVAGVGVSLDVSALGTDEGAGPRFDAGKRGCGPPYAPAERRRS